MCPAATCMLAAAGQRPPFCLHGGTALGTGRGESWPLCYPHNTFHWVWRSPTAGYSPPAIAAARLDRLREVGIARQ